MDTFLLRLQDTLPDLMKAYAIPGLALAVFKDNKIVLDVALGVKNSSTQEPVTPTTVFEAASLSKPMVA